MAASVHDADLVAVLVAHPHLAGVGHAGLFDDRQGVHVGADQDGRAVAVLEDADDAVAADLLRDLEAASFSSRASRADVLRLVQRQLRVGVEMLVQRLQSVVFGVHPLLDLGQGALVPGFVALSSGRLGCGETLPLPSS